ncbi:MAG: hypothetical protein NE328_07150 [Lentisphaeraceae bacterium]|nr:hypothetical protein [Lentisphaeraceae bacterium]
MGFEIEDFYSSEKTIRLKAFTYAKSNSLEILNQIDNVISLIDEKDTITDELYDYLFIIKQKIPNKIEFFLTTPKEHGKDLRIAISALYTRARKLNFLEIKKLIELNTEPDLVICFLLSFHKIEQNPETDDFVLSFFKIDHDSLSHVLCNILLKRMDEKTFKKILNLVNNKNSLRFRPIFAHADLNENSIRLLIQNYMHSDGDEFSDAILTLKKTDLARAIINQYANVAKDKKKKQLLLKSITKQ